jgi:hypothetical protein
MTVTRAQPAPPPIDLLVARLAETQHGVVGGWQMVDLGLGRSGIGHRVRMGRLHRVMSNVYAVGHARLSREGRWMAAVLAAGHCAVLSHASAASLWEMRRGSSPAIDVTVPTRAGRRPRHGLRIHRSGRLRPDDVTTHDAIPVTTPARTLLDIAEQIPRGSLERAVDRADALGLFDLIAVRDVLAANPGRAGSGSLTAVLDLYRDEPQLTRSELEERFLDLGDAHAIPRPVVNGRAAGFEVDFLWRSRLLVVETDGRRDHATRAAFEHDRAKDAQLVVAGYRVVRFTYRQVTREPAAVAATVVALLGAACEDRGVAAPTAALRPR